MFKILEPNKIFQITSKAPKYILFLFVIVLTVGLTEALILSPEDYKHNKKIMSTNNFVEIAVKRT